MADSWADYSGDWLVGQKVVLTVDSWGDQKAATWVDQ